MTLVVGDEIDFGSAAYNQLVAIDSSKAGNRESKFLEQFSWAEHLQCLVLLTIPICESCN